MGNWFPWVQEKFGAQNTVTIPTLPTPEGQNCNGWIAAVLDQIPDLDIYDILIGHSCGASFLPHLILSENLKPKKVIMISAFSETLGIPDYDVLIPTFFLSDDILKKYRDHTDQHLIHTIIYHGDNDPYVPLAQAKHIADLLNLDLKIIPNGGHLNAEFGYTTFPEILNDIHP